MDRHRFDRIRNLPLEPLDYCHRWVRLDPNRSYRKACIHAIAQATGLSPHTIKDWGRNFHRRPVYVLRLLRYADLINQFRQLQTQGIVTLPPNFPEE